MAELLCSECKNVWHVNSCTHVQENRDFYIIWQPESGFPTVCHQTLYVAREEARKLAASVRNGKRFYVLRAIEFFSCVDEIYQVLKEPEVQKK